jgi:DNA-binding NarL/FixJ family response regulator
LLAEGRDTAEIASRLCYSERTVKGVIHGLTTRLQLRNRSHAVAFALRNELI